MKAALTYELAGNHQIGPQYNPHKSLISDVGDLQKTSDKLMFALISIKYPQAYQEDL